MGQVIHFPKKPVERQFGFGSWLMEQLHFQMELTAFQEHMRIDLQRREAELQQKLFNEQWEAAMKLCDEARRSNIKAVAP